MPAGEVREAAPLAPAARATRQAGPPPEPEETAVPETAAPARRTTRARKAAPAGEAEAAATVTAAETGEAAPARTRSRAARKAGPPPEEHETPPAAEPAAVPSAAAEPEAEIAVVESELEQARPARRTTRRAARKAGAPGETASAETAPEETAPEVPEAEVAEERPARRRTTRTRAKAAAETEAAEAAEAAGTAEPAAPAAEEDERPRRRRVRKAEAAEAAPAAELPAAADDDDDDEAGPEDVEEAAAVAEVDDEGNVVEDLLAAFGVDEVEVEEAPRVPAATFQAPMVLFQPPVAPAPAPAKPAVPEPVEPEEDLEADRAEEDDEEHDESGSRRRRRRRGGRGRGRSKDAQDEGGEDAEDADHEAEQAQAEREETEQEQSEAGSRRRRRRRRRNGEEIEPAPDEPVNTVVRIREPRAAERVVDEVQGLRGSTRLEAKKQRRREGREHGRRRPPIITESEFLARRESVERVMVVRRHGGRTQIAVLEDGVLVEHYVDRESSQSYVGNVYLGKVQNVLPSMEAAFVDIGKGRNAVLYAGEVNFDTAGLEGQPKRIESALKSGQSVLVQVTKDPIGHKGARLTSQVSLPGRFLVYVPDGSMTGISRKLPDKERTRLKQILKKVMPENAGVIVRTAAEGASEKELESDVRRLAAQWEDIQRKAKTASPPEMLYGEPDLTIRVVRDIFNEDFSSLVVQGEDVWETIKPYVEHVSENLVDRLQKWDGDEDVFAAYRVDEQIAKALDRKVWLPSGGSLVIDRTEAMTVIDVNTGKFTGQGGNLEETVTRNNLEAAEEIVRQLRLRDVGGIIVIDFIDMVLESNRDLVLRRLVEGLARDRTKHQVAEVTSLGLVQMTRKRVGQGLLEAFSTPCECCNGRGVHVSTEPVAGTPEPRGTQGKMAIEKAVAEKTKSSSRRRRKGEDAEDVAPAGVVAAADEPVRDTVSEEVVDTQPKRRRSRRSRGGTEA
nr:Rne/Rng family ribonuclease [Bailinhaonella thermotolerans]